MTLIQPKLLMAGFALSGLLISGPILSAIYPEPAAAASNSCSKEKSALKRATSNTNKAEDALIKAQKLVDKETERKEMRIEYYERRAEVQLARSRGLQDEARGCYAGILFGESPRRCLRLEFYAKQMRERAEASQNTIATVTRIYDGKIERAETKVDKAQAALVVTTAKEAKAQEEYDRCISQLP